MTSERLHIRKLDLTSKSESGNAILGDAAEASVDEVPVNQARLNDSRSHIMSATAVTIGGTGAIEFLPATKLLTFNRDDLVLDPDESLFLNLLDIAGNLDVTFSLNIWYQE